MLRRYAVEGNSSPTQEVCGFAGQVVLACTRRTLTAPRRSVARQPAALFPEVNRMSAAMKIYVAIQAKIYRHAIVGVFDTLMRFRGCL